MSDPSFWQCYNWRIGEVHAPVSVEIVREIADGGYLYVGSPYSKYPAGLEAAFCEVAAITGWLIQQGIGAYSPIAHSHPIALYAGMDPLDHGIWLTANQCMMDAARGLIVVEMASWELSYGLAHEIDAFERLLKPIVHLLP